jgi:YesN/AraC family two-component response regulator
MQSLSEIAEVNASMQVDFVRRVRRAKSGEGVSPQVQKVCHYVQTHLMEKINIADLAEYVGITPSEYRLTQKAGQ